LQVYVYFKSEMGVGKLFEIYPDVREGLRICHAVEQFKDKLTDDDYLPDPEQMAIARNCLHLQAVATPLHGPQLRRGCSVAGAVRQ